MGVIPNFNRPYKSVVLSYLTNMRGRNNTLPFKLTIMKRIFLASLFIVLARCTNKEELPKDYFFIIPTTIEVPAEGSEVSFTIYTDQEWVIMNPHYNFSSISPTSGSGETKVVVKVPHNINNTSRIDKIEVFPKNSFIPYINVYIYQDGL